MQLVISSTLQYSLSLRTIRYFRSSTTSTRFCWTWRLPVTQPVSSEDITTYRVVLAGHLISPCTTIQISLLCTPCTAHVCKNTSITTHNTTFHDPSIIYKKKKKSSLISMILNADCKWHIKRISPLKRRESLYLCH